MRAKIFFLLKGCNWMVTKKLAARIFNEAKDYLQADWTTRLAYVWSESWTPIKFFGSLTNVNRRECRSARKREESRRADNTLKTQDKTQKKQQTPAYVTQSREFWEKSGESERKQMKPAHLRVFARLPQWRRSRVTLRVLGLRRSLLWATFLRKISVSSFLVFFPFQPKTPLSWRARVLSLLREFWLKVSLIWCNSVNRNQHHT